MRVEFTYEPLPKQIAFHRAFQTHKFPAYAGGMGSGKTLAGAYQTIKTALAYPKNLILVGRATYPELRDTTRKEVLDFPVVIDGKEMPLIASPLVRSYNKAENVLSLINGTEIVFRALLDSFDKIKSLNLGAFWVDELTEVPEEIWLGLVGRLRRKDVVHFGWGTTNPEGHDWVWKRWVMNKDDEHFIVQASSTENPFLPPGYIDSMIRNYPEEWVKRYVYGSFDSFQGLIYHEFQDKQPYVVAPFEIPDHWYRFIALDHGYRNPTAVLWFAVSPDGTAYVYDEFYERRMLVSEVAEVIKTKNGKQKIRQFLIDPSCRNTNGATGLSIIDEFGREGLYFEPANNDVRAGINRVKERLKDGKQLKIVNRCINLRTELQTYRWKDLKPGATQDAPEKPVKRDDHLCDALRYGVSYLYEGPEMKKRGTTSNFDYKIIRSDVEDFDAWKAA